jgi:hypothetical protein
MMESQSMKTLWDRKHTASRISLRQGSGRVGETLRELIDTGDYCW